MIHAASTSHGHAGSAAPSSTSVPTYTYTNTPTAMAMRPDSPRPWDVFHFQGFAAAYAHAPPTFAVGCGGAGGFVDSYPHMNGIAATTHHHAHTHTHTHPHAADLATIQEDSTPATDLGARNFGEHIAHSPSKVGSPFTHRRSIGRKRAATMKRHIKATIGKIPLWEAPEAHGHGHSHHGHSMCASG